MRLLWGAACPFLLVAFLAPSVLSSTETTGWEIDAMTFVTSVIDGDTFDSDSVGRVRLADIDTPESGEPGARGATVYLTSLIQRRSVYLDIDDLYGTDRYDRVVAVVYVRHNATHLLNVNMALWQTGLAKLVDFHNEFSPVAWSRYAFHPAQDTQDYSTMQLTIAAVAASMIVALMLALFGVYRRRST